MHETHAQFVLFLLIFYIPKNLRCTVLYFTGTNWRYCLYTVLQVFIAYKILEGMFVELQDHGKCVGGIVSIWLWQQVKGCLPFLILSLSFLFFFFNGQSYIYYLGGMRVWNTLKAKLNLLFIQDILLTRGSIYQVLDKDLKGEMSFLIQDLHLLYTFSTSLRYLPLTDVLPILTWGTAMH